jgi:hypothetical protein
MIQYRQEREVYDRDHKYELLTKHCLKVKTKKNGGDVQVEVNIPQNVTCTGTVFHKSSTKIK